MNRLGLSADDVSAAAAGIGLLLAGSSMVVTVVDRRRDAKYQTEGVAVTWTAVENPPRPGADDAGLWIYRIVVKNPGRYPISNVEVAITWPGKVRRQHGDRRLDEASEVLHLHGAPVILGGGERSWDRSLRIPYALKERLGETTAQVTFLTVDGKDKTTMWPKRRKA